MDALQYYPTPQNITDKMWAKFSNMEFCSVLDPSAGDGRLLFSTDHMPTHNKRPHDKNAYQFKRDACEIDISKHPLIRDRGVNIVGLDFLDMQDAATYSHIIMNPPFMNGAQHLLHAWNILYDGEIVAVINAETIRNQCDKYRIQLAKLIHDHNGSVEYMEDAFNSDETERKTRVEIAIVHLVKTAEKRHLFLDDVVDNLKKTEEHTDDVVIGNSLSIPTESIHNAVKAFNAAWAASKEAIILDRRVRHYKRVLGRTLDQLNNNQSNNVDMMTAPPIHAALIAEYDELKDRGWSYVLRSTDVSSITSMSVQKQLEKDFEKVKKLDFTVSNIFGFLQGLALNKGKIQTDMALEVFDSITRYHSDNRVYYMGWKSNDRHKEAAMRIKMRRFILPHFSLGGAWKDLSYTQVQQLTDIDKVFAMLDGKSKPEFGLVDAFTHNIDDLKNNERIKTSYFDIRFYKGIGTIHFFPNKTNIIDRLNILVGRARQWLPENMGEVSGEFIKQYDEAEIINKGIHWTRSEEWAWRNAVSDDEKRLASHPIVDKLADSMSKLGYTIDTQLTTPSKKTIQHDGSA